jgi:hypothetical protein
MPPSKSWEKPASVSLSGTQLLFTETRGNPITDEAGPKFRPAGASYDTLIAKDALKPLRPGETAPESGFVERLWNQCREAS